MIVPDHMQLNAVARHNLLVEFSKKGNNINVPAYMKPNLAARKWLPAEYPSVCNQFGSYKNPPIPIPPGPPIMVKGKNGKLELSLYQASLSPQAYRRYCIALYSDCHKKYHATKKKIEARQAAAAKAKQAAQRSAQQLAQIKREYSNLLRQYEQLNNQLIAERNAHRQDVELFNRLRTEVARIRNILADVGLM